MTGTRAGSYRAVVVDDEPSAREAVETLLDGVDGVDVVGVAGNGDEAVRVVRETTPDLLFLDVQMPDRDGFGVLDALGDDVPRGVVFVTAHDEHALRAFEVHALDYVLKPFGKPRFTAAVERAVARLEAQDALSWRNTVRSLVRDRHLRPESAVAIFGVDAPHGAGASTPRRIGVRVGTRTILVDVREIDWIEADGDYARLHVGEKVYLVSARMNQLETWLGGERFQRIHRSVIVSLDDVRELDRDADGGGTVVLNTGVRLRVARGRWDPLRTALGLADR